MSLFHLSRQWKEIPAQILDKAIIFIAMPRSWLLRSKVETLRIPYYCPQTNRKITESIKTDVDPNAIPRLRSLGIQAGYTFLQMILAKDLQRMIIWMPGFVFFCLFLFCFVLFVCLFSVCYKPDFTVYRHTLHRKKNQYVCLFFVSFAYFLYFFKSLRLLSTNFKVCIVIIL